LEFESDSRLTRIEELCFSGCSLKSYSLPSSVVDVTLTAFDHPSEVFKSFEPIAAEARELLLNGGDPDSGMLSLFIGYALIVRAPLRAEGLIRILQNPSTQTHATVMRNRTCDAVLVNQVIQTDIDVAGDVVTCKASQTTQMFTLWFPDPANLAQFCTAYRKALKEQGR
jgi:hypothetical protein